MVEKAGTVVGAILWVIIIFAAYIWLRTTFFPTPSMSEAVCQSEAGMSCDEIKRLTDKMFDENLRDYE